MKKIKVYWIKKCKVVNNYEKNKNTICLCVYESWRSREESGYLLNLIDYSKYDVDLLLLQKQGAFLKTDSRTGENT